MPYLATYLAAASHADEHVLHHGGFLWFDNLDAVDYEGEAFGVRYRQQATAIKAGDTDEDCISLQSSSCVCGKKQSSPPVCVSYVRRVRADMSRIDASIMFFDSSALERKGNRLSCWSYHHGKGQGGRTATSSYARLLLLVLATSATGAATATARTASSLL